MGRTISWEKPYMINVSWEETQMEIKPGITLNNTNKWTKNMTVNFIKIEKHDRNLGQGFMKKWKKYDMTYIKIQKWVIQRINAAIF